MATVLSFGGATEDKAGLVAALREIALEAVQRNQPSVGIAAAEALGKVGGVENITIRDCHFDARTTNACPCVLDEDEKTDTLGFYGDGTSAN